MPRGREERGRLVMGVKRVVERAWRSSRGGERMLEEDGYTVFGRGWYARVPFPQIERAVPILKRLYGETLPEPLTYQKKGVTPFLMNKGWLERLGE